MTKKVLMTGRNGFIGSNLSRYLESRGYMVTGFSHKLLTNPATITEALVEHTPDYIIHLAAYGNHYNQKDNVETFFANVTKTFMLLESTKNYKYKGFLNTSSSSVYGNKSEPMKEGMMLNPQSFYGATKVSGEYLASSYAKNYNLPIVNVRPFSVYGSGEAEHRFIPTVIRSILNGEKMTLDPNPKHDWIHVDDFSSGIETILENVKELRATAINIGTGIQYTNMDIVEKLEWILDKPSKYKLKENLRDYDSQNWVADNKKLTGLGWSPKYDIMKGLKHTIKVESLVHD